MQLFYAPNIESEKKLPKDEARHCLKVLRKTDGDLIDVIDGKGNLFNCEISGNELIIKSKTKEFGKRNSYLHIAIAPTKNMDRIEWFVEKATEIGIDEITFLLCDHSERRNLKVERVEKKAISAMKQSLTAYLPKLNELTKVSDFVKMERIENKFIAHLSDNSKSLKSQNLKSQNLILIGPEGDFSEREIELAITNDFKEVSLGDKRLRTETAALFAVVNSNL